MKNLIDNYIQNLTPLSHIGNSDVLTSKKSALEFLKLKGLPNKKLEDWKYTNPQSSFPEEFKLSAMTNEKNASDFEYVIDKTSVVSFRNGQFVKENSVLPRGIEINENIHGDINLSQSDDSLEALNIVSTENPIEITIPENFQTKTPVTIIHSVSSDSEGKFIVPRVTINVGRFSEVSFVEIFLGEDELNYQMISSTSFNVAEEAKVEHVKVQLDSKYAFHRGSVKGNLKQNSTFHSFTFNLGAKVARNNIWVELPETGATAEVNGLYALRDSQHCDNFSHIHHLSERTYSHQLFKGIVDDSAHGIFTGKIVVHRDAQLVDSHQLNKNLLLSKKAHVNTRPQLEVYADDVKCAHGATIGQMSEEEVFYLESRGIPKEEAQKILCRAFANDALEKVKNLQVRDKLGSWLFERFEKYALEKLGDVQ